MDVDEDKTKPESNRTLLIQQVDEQSEFCDITVKVGSWAKMYHKCVLVVSPFFEHSALGNFLEEQTGVVEVTTGTPDAVDIALMFLYGKKPVINLENVGTLLELAEYFILSNLKAACINYLHSQTMTEENCMDVLRLCATYNFEVKSCIEFIESHLSQLLRGDRLLNLSENSVKYLFSHDRFCYVAMDEKLNFLSRWFRNNTAATRSAVEKLFQNIDVREVTPSVLEEIKHDSDFSEITGISNKTVGRNNENECQRVMVITGGESFYCLDTQTKKWCRLNSKIYNTSYPFDEFPNHMTGITSSKSEIYFLGSRFSSTMTSINLATDDCVTHVLNLGHNFVNWRDTAIFSMNDEIIVAGINNNVRRRERNLGYLGDLFTHRYSLLTSNSVNQIRETKNDNSELHIGYNAGANITMSHVLSLRKEQISKLCINRQSAIALLLKSKKYILIFDLVDYKLEQVELATEEKDNMVENKDGFLIYNDKRCVCLERLQGPSLSRKYRSKEFHFEIMRNCAIRHDFCKGLWFRYSGTAKHAELQYTSHEEMVAARCSNSRDAEWNLLPLPNDCDLRLRLKLSKWFVVELPKYRLRCHLKCPHCEFENECAKEIVVRNVTYIPSSSEGYYADSSDEEESVDFGWQMEEDEDYYFSSD